MSDKKIPTAETNFPSNTYVTFYCSKLNSVQGNLYYNLKLLNFMLFYKPNNIIPVAGVWHGVDLFDNL